LRFEPINAFIFQETEHAKNQNEPFCSEAIQTNGNWEIRFLEILWQSYFDQKDHQTQAIFEKKPDYRQIQRQRVEIITAERVETILGQASIRLTRLDEFHALPFIGRPRQVKRRCRIKEIVK